MLSNRVFAFFLPWRMFGRGCPHLMEIRSDLFRVESEIENAWTLPSPFGQAVGDLPKQTGKFPFASRKRFERRTHAP